jgi:hypothetical protein
MLRGFFRRALVPIFLMATLIAPTVVCLQTQHKAAHSCCRHASHGPAFSMNCCVVRPTPPAVPVTPVLPDAAPAVLGHASFPAFAPVVAVIQRASVAEPPHSPPPGAFSLRI